MNDQIVDINGAGHYVSDEVKNEITRLRGAELRASEAELRASEAVGLRVEVNHWRDAYRQMSELANKSTKELNRLTKEVDTLRKALQEITDTDMYPDHEDTAPELREIARNALGGKDAK